MAVAKREGTYNEQGIITPACTSVTLVKEKVCVCARARVCACVREGGERGWLHPCACQCGMCSHECVPAHTPACAPLLSPRRRCTRTPSPACLLA